MFGCHNIFIGIHFTYHVLVLVEKSWSTLPFCFHTAWVQSHVWIIRHS